MGDVKKNLLSGLIAIAFAGINFLVFYYLKLPNQLLMAFASKLLGPVSDIIFCIIMILCLFLGAVVCLYILSFMIVVIPGGILLSMAIQDHLKGLSTLLGIGLSAAWLIKGRKEGWIGGSQMFPLEPFALVILIIICLLLAVIVFLIARVILGNSSKANLAVNEGYVHEK